MDIGGMRAGPELDALLAREVMGWEPAKDGIWWHDKAGNRCGSGDFPAALPAIVGTKVIDGRGQNSDGGRRCVFSPSVNISHALEALGHWCAEAEGRDWTCGLSSAYLRPGYDHAGANWCDLDDVGETGPATYAKTLPLAICRALLGAARQ